jgi:hypothetical protein
LDDWVKKRRRRTKKGGLRLTQPMDYDTSPVKAAMNCGGQVASEGFPHGAHHDYFRTNATVSGSRSISDERI